MAYVDYLIAGIFLPLFPFSMLLNVLYGRIQQPLLRSLILLLWPQAGLYLVFYFGLSVPGWLVGWALLTSMLYALRLLVLREVGLWTSFIATSAWALLWILFEHGTDRQHLELFALGISVPLVLMALLGAGLERRFGAAYLGLYNGLAHSLPRFSGILAIVVLAVIATPLFPGFFAMFSLILKSIPTAPAISLGVAIVWLLWSWAGARLLQGLIAGPQTQVVDDLSRINMWLYIAVLAGLVFTGVYSLGVMA
jgi:hypothetical protein